ncbi:MAG: MFS transporter [Deltaproteobacteria bacterium]|nr:MFS transporter [Deltaproteobacteria bacterium]
MRCNPACRFPQIGNDSLRQSAQVDHLPHLHRGRAGEAEQVRAELFDAPRARLHLIDAVLMLGIFYGWWIVAVAFLTHCVTTGIVFYSFGVFLTVLTEAFGWSRAEVSWGFSLVAVCGAVYAPFVGRIVDRRGPRLSQIIGALALAGGFALLRGIESRLAFYLVMGGLVSLGATALGPLPSNTAVANWFVRRRGRALGLATAGISMGGVIFVPLTQYLVEHIGWRNAFGALALIIVAVVIPPVAWLMVRRPEDLGLCPDGGERGGATGLDLELEIERSLAAPEAMRQRNFWLITVSFALTVLGLSATLIHQVSFLRDRGIPAGAAAWTLGATAGVGVVGKLGFGYLLDNFDQRHVIVWCFGLQALGLALLMATFNVWTLALFVVVYGFAMGGNATLQATILGDCFGRLYYGAIAGRMQPFIVIGQAIGTPLVGAIRDSGGSYIPAFAMILVLNVVAMACIARLRLPGKTKGPPG